MAVSTNNTSSVHYRSDWYQPDEPACVRHRPAEFEVILGNEAYSVTILGEFDASGAAVGARLVRFEPTERAPNDDPWVRRLPAVLRRLRNRGSVLTTVNVLRELNIKRVNERHHIDRLADAMDSIGYGRHNGRRVGVWAPVT